MKNAKPNAKSKVQNAECPQVGTFCTLQYAICIRFCIFHFAFFISHYFLSPHWPDAFTTMLNALNGASYLLKPVSVPNSSAAPSVTTGVPGAGPVASTAVSPLTARTTTRRRVKARSPVCSYTQVPP